MDAIDRVMETTDIAGRCAVNQNRDLYVLVMLDVHAFNSAPRPFIDAALQSKQTPQYLIRIIRYYLEDRSVMVGGEKKIIACGVLQGSVISPTLWNVMYDELLKLPMPQGVEIIGFADNITITVIGHNKEIVEMLANSVLDRINTWMQSHGL